MPHLPYLTDIVVLFGAALVVISVSHRLRVPPVVGFLATGVLVGPSGLALVDDVHHVEVFAELGVIFLLFVIGLEMSPDRLRQLGRYALQGGSLQVGLTTVVVALAAVSLDQAPARAVYLGFVVALSSTAIVLKLYSERRALDAPHGRVVMGVLLLQDFLIVPLLLVVPVLASAGEAGTGEIALRFGAGLALVAAVFAGGRYVVPPLLRLIVHTRIRELFVLGALFACLGAAKATELLGFSPALGAFLAGLLIAESEYHHQVLAETAPFRDVFSSMFFISIGMLVDLGAVRGRPAEVLAAGAALIVVKAVVAVLAVRSLRLPWRTAVIAGLGLAQVGEFSFVLIRSGREHGLLPAELYQLSIAAAVLTMALTPPLIAAAPRLASWLTRLRGGGAPAGGEAPGLAGHVIIAGFGLNGRHLARVLRSARKPYLAVDLNGCTVRRAKQEGEPILYGDVTRRDILERCGVASADIAVLALSDPPALRKALRLARQLNPRLTLIARTRQLAEIEELMGCGADEVIAEEFETSIEVVTRVLTRLHLPRSIIRAEARLLRGDGYQMLRAPDVPGLSEELSRALAAGAADSFLLAAGHGAVGCTIRQLDLRQRSGATILAVIRGATPLPNPPADTLLAAGDVLVLVGSHAEIDAAFGVLEETSL